MPEGEAATLHALSAPPGSALERALALGDSFAHRGTAPLVAALPLHVVSVSAPSGLLERAGEGLPEGAARAEALAVRLRRRGVALEWGAPELVSDPAELLARCEQLGRSSLRMIRADPSLLSEMHVGSWFDGTASARALRRLAVRAPARCLTARAAAGRVRPLRVLIDAAFWAGVASEASEAEWRRLSASSYVALLYHRIAGEERPGEERLDVSPARFAAHMRLLRLLRFTALGRDEQLRFHVDPEAALPRRSVVLSVDDGLRDCAAPLRAHAAQRPQLFVCTRELGGRAHWMAGEQVLDWPEVESLRRAGVAIGSHGRRHEPLDGLPDDRLSEELDGSRRDLRERLGEPPPLLSYPNGRHDERVRSAAAHAGFEAAFTTEKGANGAGTDRWCLKRVSVYGYDGPLALAWKALTGQAVPAAVERRRRARLARGVARPRGAVRGGVDGGGAQPDALVSLVMPVYRPRPDWLHEAVRSALGQHDCEIELIVVDDGSPAPVAPLLADLDEPRMKLLRIEHGGPSRARNAGVAVARGQYVRFVDGDDVLEPDGTAHLLRLAGGEQDVIAYGATLVCDEHMRPVGIQKCRLDGSIATACLLDEVEVRLFSMLFPRAVLEATGEWDTELPNCRDWDYALRAFEQARVRGDEKVVTRYRRHRWSVTADIESCLRGERGVIERYLERHPEQRGTSIERRCRARLHRTEARTYQLRRTGRRPFAAAMARSLALAPLDTGRELARDAGAGARRLISSLLRTARGPAPR